MWQFWKRAGPLTCALASMVAGFATDTGAQGVPTERSIPPPVAESARGFTTVTSVRELDGGRVLVADRAEVSLYLLDWKTGTIDQILRRGDGPGEYRSVGWLYAVGDDETLFTDTGRRWILLRDTDVVHTFVETSPLNRRFRPPLDGVAKGGSVLASVSAESPGSTTAPSMEGLN